MIEHHDVHNRRAALAKTLSRQRRRLAIFVGGSAAALAVDGWHKPVVRTVLLPLHAQGSSIPGTTPPPQPARAVEFSSSQFKNLLVQNSSINTNNDSEISEAEAAAYGGLIGVESNGITDLRGIEAFTALTQLLCQKNQLTTLDLRNNPRLISLSCWSNKLTILNVSNNAALERLSCDDNELTTLDLSSNTQLMTRLYCHNNKLTTLDLRNNPKLVDLLCQGNRLTTLNLSNSPALTRVSCQNNQLRTLDVGNNTALTQLECSNNDLTALNVSNNTRLTRLYCRDNDLTALDLSTNPQLEIFDCRDNNLEMLNVSNNPKMHSLDCRGNTELQYILVADKDNVPVTWVKDATAEFVEEIPVP